MAFVLALLPGLATAQKLRVIVLTDIENEPDDAMSMVRLLTYANQWDVEGLIATTSVHQRDKTAAWRIREIVEAYGKVRDNLEKHEPGYPTADYLLSVIREGRPAYGMAAVGAGMDSPGSDRIIQVVDRDDPRPVWVPVWGGPNCLAQALWKVRATRSPAALDRFVSKLRVYTISDQDDSGPWMRKTFPDLFYIASPGMHAGRRVSPRHLERHQRRQLPRPLRRRRLQHRGQSLARQEHPQQGTARRPASADDVPDGGRHAELSLSRRQRAGRSGASRLGQLGRPLRALHAADAEVVPRTGNAAVLERRGRRGPRRRRQVAHEQQGDDLALALGLSERFRRAHGLDDQAVRRGQPSAGRQARHIRTSSR